MKAEQTVRVSSWKNAINDVANGTGALSREVVFDSVISILSGAISEFQGDGKNSKLKKRNKEVVEEKNKWPAIANFFNLIKSEPIKSLGVHFVDPISGRHSDIWWKHDGTLTTQQSALYSRAWNRIYRRLYRPRATLINAIESGVLPWMWQTVHLATQTSPADSTRASLNLFFKDTRILAEELYKCISKETVYYSTQSDTEVGIESVFQAVWNDLERNAFVSRLNRIATRFQDSILDDPASANALREYLSLSGGKDIPDILNNEVLTSQWGQLLDVIQAIQSSALSFPAFCNENGLWLHRVDFANSGIDNETSIYFIFGLNEAFDVNAEIYRSARDSFTNLGRAIHAILKSIEKPKNLPVSDMTTELCTEIRARAHDVFYCNDGLARWLEAVQKLAREAKHEGHPITYNVGYGSLAYAQSHFHRYERPPKDLDGSEASIGKIASYVKGFYSIFGNRNNRGLWFDETGRYRGVFESLNGHFQIVSADKPTPQHEGTVLLATVRGQNIFDIYKKDTILIRVKNGVRVEIAQSEKRLNKAVKFLASKDAIPNKYKEVTGWIVNILVDMFQAETHGTSFVISFDDQPSQLHWRTKIEAQSKTLTLDFSQLKAPLATWEQMGDYAKEGSKRPAHIFSLLTELANLDGGLWLHLSDKSGLTVRAAQQFIPLLKLPKKRGVRPLDLQMSPILLEANNKVGYLNKNLPTSANARIEKLVNLKTLFGAINGEMELKDVNVEVRRYLEALSILHHSGTKTHSLWGLSLTAMEKCLCVVLSSDGHAYIFYEGREFASLEKLVNT